MKTEISKAKTPVVSQKGGSRLARGADQGVGKSSEIHRIRNMCILRAENYRALENHLVQRFSNFFKVNKLFFPPNKLFSRWPIQKMYTSRTALPNTASSLRLYLLSLPPPLLL